MPYIINFSDPTKQTNITIPDMPPGINTVDTTLSLVGRGYPNYGQKFAENFVHLLENFASPIPPENPIEGQLWYDTSSPSNKVLRIMDGTANDVRWPSANGIYQQSTNPNNSYTVKNGDLWIDTAENKVKLWNGLTWQLVGPAGDTSSSQVTGSIPEQITDVNDNSAWVIKNYVNGEVISIVAGLTTSTFIPRQGISGFISLKPGLNLSSRIFDSGASTQVNGIASSANGLTTVENGYKVSYPTSEFLRKNDDGSTNGIPNQQISGYLVFRGTTATTLLTNPDTFQLGKDGIVLLPQNETTNFVQLYKNKTSGILLNNSPGGKLEFKVKKSGGNLETKISVDPTTGVLVSSNISITGNSSITGTLQVTSTVNFSGSLNVVGAAKAESVTANKVSLGTYLDITTSTVTPYIDNNFVIGSYGKQIKRIYAKEIGSTGTVIYGNLIGSAVGLSTPVQMTISGQVLTSVPSSFNGTEASVNFNTLLSQSAITDWEDLADAGGGSYILVASTNINNNFTGLRKITKNNFFRGAVSPPGTISIFGSSVMPTGWLLCNGKNDYSITDYPDLYNVIGNNYGGDAGYGTFAVPIFFDATDLDGHAIYYMIKY